MTHTPLSDRVLIKKIDLEFKTSSGLILGEIERERETCFGRVVAVGEGKQIDSGGKIPMTVKAGDIIICNVKMPTKLNIRGEEFYILRESDVYEIIAPEKGEEFTITEINTAGREFNSQQSTIMN